MNIYVSKNKIDTSEQFVLTLDSDLSKEFSFGFILDNKITSADSLSTLPKIRSYQSKANIMIDNTNNILKDDDYASISGTTKIKLKKKLNEKEVFKFFNDECILIGEKIYEKINSLKASDSDVYTQDGIAFSNRGKYELDDTKKYATIDIAKYPIIALFSYVDGKLHTKKYVSSLEANKLKLTISDIGEINLIFEKNGEIVEKLSYFYNFSEDNYLYIFSNQNILSNAAVSCVESSDTSANIA